MSGQPILGGCGRNHEPALDDGTDREDACEVDLLQRGGRTKARPAHGSGTPGGPKD